LAIFNEFDNYEVRMKLSHFSIKEITVVISVVTDDVKHLAFYRFCSRSGILLAFYRNDNYEVRMKLGFSSSMI
jgi:hypothetical protein